MKSGHVQTRVLQSPRPVGHCSLATGDPVYKSKSCVFSSYCSHSNAWQLPAPSARSAQPKPVQPIRHRIGHRSWKAKFTELQFLDFSTVPTASLSSSSCVVPGARSWWLGKPGEFPWNIRRSFSWMKKYRFTMFSFGLIMVDLQNLKDGVRLFFVGCFLCFIKYCLPLISWGMGHYMCSPLQVSKTREQQVFLSYAHHTMWLLIMP